MKTCKKEFVVEIQAQSKIKKRATMILKRMVEWLVGIVTRREGRWAMRRVDQRVLGPGMSGDVLVDGVAGVC